MVQIATALQQLPDVGCSGEDGHRGDVPEELAGVPGLLHHPHKDFEVRDPILRYPLTRAVWEEEGRKGKVGASVPGLMGSRVPPLRTVPYRAVRQGEI